MLPRERGTATDWGYQMDRSIAFLATAALVLSTVVPAATALPIGGAADVDLGEEPLADGAEAIPLAREPPDWVTPEARRKASQAAQLGLGYNVETGELVEPASGGPAELLIRPGTWEVSPAWCTLAFVAGSSGSYDIWTAGHCLDNGKEVFVATTPGVIFAIGKGNGRAGGVGNDYGSIDIYDQWQPYVDPDTAIVGGPGLAGGCAVFDGVASLTNPEPVKHVGHGIGIGTGGTPRAGVSLHANQKDDFLESQFSDKAVYWDGAAAPGDSGSPVLATGDPAGCPLGEGLAILTHLVVVGPNAQYIAGTNVDRVGTPTVGNGLPT